MFDSFAILTVINPNAPAESATCNDERTMMKKTLPLMLAALLALTPFIGTHAADNPLTVVTSFYPLYIFAQNILKDVPGVALQNLTHPTTGCLHDYQLLTTDMKTLAQADALIINGGGMESFLPVVQEQFAGLTIMDTSAGIELIPAYELMADAEDDHDHDEEEAHDDDDHEGHDHGEFNAHIWLDPRNAVAMTATMAEAMQALLPDQAALIASNAQAYQAKLTALDAELREKLSGLARRDIVTFHEAFPYFARAYGLHVVAVLALEPEESLTPQMVATLVDKVRAHNLPPLFTEPQYEDRAARAVAQETGAKVYELDPVVTGDGGLTAYEDTMRRNADVLLEALGTR